MLFDRRFIGRFVWIPNLGPGKIIAVEPNRYKVEYFYSPWKRRTISQDTEFVPYELSPKTRVYIELDGGWKTGQVNAVYRSRTKFGGNEYGIEFLRRPPLRIHEKFVFCRCLDAHDDPTLSLATQGVENQPWHERRHRFTVNLIEQRAAVGGLGCLLSSAIRFVPHQVETVRRVLEDPLQRYLLADEVGMGKTIEAGLIIRQLLLSTTDGTVWVIAPRNLIEQWKKELLTKFYIENFPNRIRFFGPDELGDMPEKSPALLVVDEAHHFVSNEIHQSLLSVAERATRLLLLSATPALGRSDVLLSLLRLLDPDCYRGVTIESFQLQVDRRDEIGYFLRGLRPDASQILLKQRLRNLPTLFPLDEEALQLGLRISSAIEADDSDTIRRMINQLRGYLADVHRINQRLIRTRRRDAVSWAFKPRGQKPEEGSPPVLSHVHCAFIEEEFFFDLFDLFDQWRNETAAAVDQNQVNSEIVIPYLLKIFDAFAVGIDTFEIVLSNLPGEVMPPSWSTAFRSVLAGRTRTGRYEQVAAEIEDFFHRVGTVACSAMPRIAVFGSDANDLQNCAQALAKRMSQNPVVLAENLDGEEIANLFGVNCSANFLFCGPDSEEGLNLQFMDAVVHLDLPLAPVRVEQRIGRLDRFGRKLGHLEQLVILPLLPQEMNCWDAWYEILSISFRVFNQPITDVFFSLEAAMEEISQSLLMSGAVGLRGSVDRISEIITEERERLDNQYVLDQILREQEGQADCYSALLRVEDNESEIRTATLDWAVKCLGFQIIEDPKQKSFEIQWHEKRTQLPKNPWGLYFAKVLNAKLTFKRAPALRGGPRSSPQIARFGSRFMHHLEQHLRWEDRGTAFATWRHLPQIDDDIWLGFKLCYIIEAHLPSGLSVDEIQSLQSRLDTYLTPWVQTFFIDGELQIVSDPVRLRMLELPFDEGIDTNLARCPQLFDQLVNNIQFETLCQQVREHSEVWLRNNESYQRAVKEAVEKGQLDIQRRIMRLKQRKKLRTENGETIDSGLDRDIELNNKLLEVLPNPAVRLDAIGLIALSRLSIDDYGDT
jgi:ATP-dependent helicase HepA